MTVTGSPAASNASETGRDELRRPATGRRIATIACLAGLAGVAAVGLLHPLAVAGGAQPSATDALAVSGLGAVWGSSDTTGGLNWIDLITKGTIVLALLFITLRVLGRMGTGAQKRSGRLEVLESRPLAPKASLHLVAIGDRRLVVGLTPSGMVSLAELDAAELETYEAETAPDGRSAAPAFATPTFGSALNSVLAPLDSLTGKLATFLNGGRVR
jgi:flagellar biosynthetic protein FliO